MTSLRQMLRAPTESQLQQQIVEGLRLAGYVVLEVGRWHRQVKCLHCGVFFTPRSGTGNTPGTPDLLVSRQGFGPRWYGLEIKTPAITTLLGSAPAGRLRPEQRALVNVGLVLVIHSLDEALAALEAC